MKKETFIADGRKFQNMEQVEGYAKSKGLRVVNTETIRKGVFVIDLRSIETPIKTPAWWNDLYTDANGNCFSDVDSGL